MAAIVYFSSASNNTARFVESCGFDMATYRIPLRAAEPSLTIDDDYVLITPTYGGGRPGHSVPIQVKRFLSDKGNASHLRGVIASGNMNFGDSYCHAGDVISARFNVPYLYRFELLGTAEDARNVREGIAAFFQDHK
jgi:protein involved in ribonucleotide reduction